MLQKFKTAPKVETYSVPSLASVSPETAALATKEREITTLMSSLEAERQKLWSVAKCGRDDGDDKVAALLGDDVDEDEPSRQIARTRLSEIARETETARKALEVLRGRMSAARAAASTKVVDAVRPEYAKRVAALAANLIVAYRSHLELLNLTSALNDAGVSWGALTPLQATRVMGGWRDNYSAVAIWLREAAQAGYLNKTDIPEEIR